MDIAENIDVIKDNLPADVAWKMITRVYSQQWEKILWEKKTYPANKIQKAECYVRVCSNRIMHQQHCWF